MASNRFHPPYSVERGRARFRASRTRLRASALPIAQCALAAGLAWFVANDLLHHNDPFFAPIAAVVSLGMSFGGRLRRALELMVGVTVGIGVGDLLISWIGTGAWQIVLVVALAMATAVFLDGGPVIAMQAASSAVLVATLIPPSQGGGPDRMFDALVGGLVGVLVVAFLPAHPVLRARKQAADILADAADVLQKVADGLVANDPKPIEAALKRARTTQASIDALQASLRGGREISRVSPLYWTSRPRLARMTAAAEPLDNAIRNIRVLTRRSLTLVRDDEILDPRLVDQIEKLSHAVAVLRRMVLADPGQQPDQAEAARVLRSVSIGMKPELVEDAGISATVVFAQIRSLLVDLMQVAGLSRISAIATLPPTVPKPGYPTDH
ncbi:FUSC family protein [Rhodococcus gannanensis]|uniref:Aromatic acid exporter family protein n=1 Tax=Rhodococcus gannanensis TaxID=1960308 RepID=A0ABW4PAG6_9NOCA